MVKELTNKGISLERQKLIEIFYSKAKGTNPKPSNSIRVKGFHFGGTALRSAKRRCPDRTAPLRLCRGSRHQRCNNGEEDRDRRFLLHCRTGISTLRVATPPRPSSMLTLTILNPTQQYEAV